MFFPVFAFPSEQFYLRVSGLLRHFRALNYFLLKKYKMSSVTSVTASPTHHARFFVNAKINPYTYSAVGAQTTITVAAVGGVVVRDMGKTIRTPVTVLTGTYALTNQLILRKVARVQAQTALVAGNPPTAGFVGFSQGGEDPSLASSVFYINLYDGNWVNSSA